MLQKSLFMYSNFIKFYVSGLCHALSCAPVSLFLSLSLSHVDSLELPGQLDQKWYHYRPNSP